MAIVSMQCSERTLARLRDEYQQLQGNASATAPLPAFETWLAQADLASANSTLGASSDIQLFRIMEDLITGLEPAGYTLVHHADSDEVDAATDRLAQALMQHFAAPEFYLKRIQDLLTYYQKPVDHVTTMVRTQEVERLAAAMILAFQALFERSIKALDHLSDDRAIGRIEGAVAMLVSGGAVTRTDAQRQAAAFKKAVRNRKTAR